MNESGWELQKENIQPLTSGRNMSLLTQSLDVTKSAADHEAEIEVQVGELTKGINIYEGDDPIEPHLALIKFLEHQCIQNITWKKALTAARMSCFEKFYENQDYYNDKRYIEAVIKCLNDAVGDVGERFKILYCALSKKGIGKHLSLMYITVAELQESLGKSNEALNTLKTGVKENAQPDDKLQDAIMNLEFRIVAELAKMSKGNISTNENRNFGASVPVYGEKHEAPVFRNDLQPANPVMDRQQISSNKAKNVQIPYERSNQLYSGENENNQTPSSTSSGPAPGFNVVEKLLEPRTNKENKLLPSIWNKPDVAVIPEPRPYEAPRERIEIFTEEITSVKTHSLRTVVGDGVLKERTTESSTAGSEQFNLLGQSSASISSATNTDKQQTDTAGPMIIPNAKLMSARTLLPNGKPASFEHRMRDAWIVKQKAKQSFEAERNEKLRLADQVFKLEREIIQLREVEASLRENFEAELKQKATKEAQWEQQRNQYNDTIERLATEVSQYKEQIQQLTLDYKTAVNSLQNQYDSQIEDLNSENSRLEANMEQLKMQLEIAHQQLQFKNHCSNNSSNNGNSKSVSDSQPSSTSKESECTFISRPPTQAKSQNMSQSHSMALATDKLMNATGMMSYVDSFQAPPSRISPEISRTNTNEISINPEISFNASVKMHGTTTVFGWRDDKTKFCFGSLESEDDEDAEKDEQKDSSQKSNQFSVSTQNAPPPADMFLQPPAKPSSKKFVLYESMSDSKSLPSRSSENPFLNNKRKPLESKTPTSNFKALSENVAPLPPPRPTFSTNAPVVRVPTTPGRVGARIAEIEALSTSEEITEPRNERMQSNNNIGQTFNVPTSRHKFLQQGTADESIFEPYQPPDDLPFDMSNLTCALQCGPAPLLNSTPQRESSKYESSRRVDANRFNTGNFVNTQRIPRISECIRQLDNRRTCPSPPRNDDDEARRHREDEEWKQDSLRRLAELQGGDSMQNGMMNLSTIQETSKENRSSCTTGSSSSGNMTRATMSGVSMFNSVSRSVSSAGTKSGTTLPSTSSNSRSLRFPYN